MRLISILMLSLCSSVAWAAGEVALRLDFGKVVDNGFLCAETGAVCRVDSQASVQDGALQATPFSHVSVPALPALRGEDELTVSAWVAPAKAPREYEAVLYKGKRQGDTVQQIHFWLSLFDGRPEFKFKDAEGKWQGIMRNGSSFLVPGRDPIPLKDIPQVPARRWSHLAATFRQGHVVLYLDAKPLLSADVPVQRLTPNAHPLRIGEAEDLEGHRAYFLPALVDDVRVVNRALAAEEIAAEYRGDRPGKPEGEIAVRPTLPPGYDPEFKTKLPLVEAYERSLPPAVKRERVSASVRPYRGAPTLHIDGKPVLAVAMMPEPYASDEGITRSCRDFAAAGAQLYSEIFWTWMRPGQGCFGWWLGPGKYDFDRVDRRIRAILQANPNALLFPRLKLNMPDWWLKEHPDEIALGANGKSGGQASLASELWEESYERMLRDVIRHMEASDYAGHIIGYHPAGGGSSEWFWWAEEDVPDYSPAAKKRFRKWLAERYKEEGALRRAWGGDTLTFDTAEPPTAELRAATERLLFRDPRKAQAVVDYKQFLCDMVSRNIVRSCSIVKEETGGRKLAGAFYGYSTYCINTLGFQGLSRVLASPQVDFLSSPTAYDRRRGGEAGVFVSGYTGSYRLHGKLYWDEVDTRTHLCPTFESYRTETLGETVAVLERAFGYTLTQGTGLWWFLLAGNATFHQAEVMDAVARMHRAATELVDADRTPIHDVAVFADERSMLYSNSNTPFRNALLRQTRDELACMGAPHDLYLLEDIAHPDLPDYKLYVFLNAFKVDEATRRAIDARVKRAGKTALWVYAPGYLGEEGFTEGGMRSLTGIGLRAHLESLKGELRLSDTPHPITARMPRRQQWAWEVGPVFSVEDPAAAVLGYTGTYPSLAVKEQGGWRSVYSLLPPTRELLQGVCRQAGVHLYSESFDPFFANAGFALLHTATAGAKRIALPRPADVTDALTGRVVGHQVRAIEETLPAGATRIYRLR